MYIERKTTMITRKIAYMLLDVTLMTTHTAEYEMKDSYEDNVFGCMWGEGQVELIERLLRTETGSVSNRYSLQNWVTLSKDNDKDDRVTNFFTFSLYTNVRITSRYKAGETASQESLSLDAGEYLDVERL